MCNASKWIAPVKGFELDFYPQDILQALPSKGAGKLFDWVAVEFYFFIHFDLVFDKRFNPALNAIQIPKSESQAFLLR